MSSPRSSELLDKARDAAQRAYAPYSNFPVGAALALADGRVITGCNVENASYGLGICAERTAVTRAVTTADTSHPPRIEAVAIVGLKAAGKPCAPCGACRQVLHEFGCSTVIVEDDGEPRELDFATQILPLAFGPEDVKE